MTIQAFQNFFTGEQNSVSFLHLIQKSFNFQNSQQQNFKFKTPKSTPKVATKRIVFQTLENKMWETYNGIHSKWKI